MEAGIRVSRGHGRDWSDSGNVLEFCWWVFLMHEVWGMWGKKEFSVILHENAYVYIRQQTKSPKWHRKLRAHPKWFSPFLTRLRCVFRVLMSSPSWPHLHPEAQWSCSHITQIILRPKPVRASISWSRDWFKGSQSESSVGFSSVIAGSRRWGSWSVWMLRMSQLLWLLMAAPLEPAWWRLRWESWSSHQTFPAASLQCRLVSQYCNPKHPK